MGWEGLDCSLEWLEDFIDDGMGYRCNAADITWGGIPQNLRVIGMI